MQKTARFRIKKDTVNKACPITSNALKAGENEIKMASIVIIKKDLKAVAFSSLSLCFFCSPPYFL